MTGPAQRWQLVSPPQQGIDALAAALAIPPLLARLLLNRGLQTSAAARAFIDPQLAALPDPYQMADAELAAGRLADAIVAGQRICVYGDYDVDGVTSSALLYRFLGELGVKPEVFLPNRFRESYGLDSRRLSEICDAGAQLIIAVDCGSKAVAEVKEVVARGVDLIICDHHTFGDELPPATALMNPNRSDCSWPHAHPSAVGVALVLAQATRRVLADRGWFGTGRPPPRLTDLLQYAALGTIADMMSLRGFNRIVAAHGLRRLGRSSFPGVVALKRRAHLDEIASADHVGFILGPRINAAGRVASATVAFTMLTTASHEEAAELADQIEVENNRRRELQAVVSPAAIQAADNQVGREHAVVVSDPDWHEGVVGIVAARVKNHFAVPAFVLSVKDGIAKGSGRSIEQYDLVAGLREIAGPAAPGGLLRRYGGHRYAAGVTLDAARIDDFRAALVAHVAATLPLNERLNAIRIDAELTLDALSLAVVEQLDRLEPFGKDNPRPAFLLRDVVIAQLQLVGQGKDWARLRLVEQSDRPLWARQGVKAFGPAAPFATFSDGDNVDVVFRLERNNFRGEVSLQATIVALAPAGQPVQDIAPEPSVQV